MEWKDSYYDRLILKIDEFTRKFYLNQFLRGMIWYVGMLTAVFLAFNLLENYFYFGKSVRKVLFYSFIGLSLGTFYYWMVRPLMHYFRLGKLISHEEASRIIGTHFSDVQDKLLNVLQLKSQSVAFTDRSLIEASIAQKARELQPVPFVKAVDLQKNRRYLRYAIWPLLMLFSILLLAPSLIKDPTKRLIQNDQEFTKAAPFNFVLENENLEALQNSDFELKVKTKGKSLPAEVFVEYDHYLQQCAKGSALPHLFGRCEFGRISAERNPQTPHQRIRCKTGISCLHRPCIRITPKHRWIGGSCRHAYFLEFPD